MRVLGDPAGDALAERDLELVRRLVHVLADLALHRDRDELLAGQPVDPDVVVVDELAELGGDGHADLLRRADRRLSRVPSCWIDWSWAAHVAMRSKSCAARIATLAWVARAAIVSSSSSVHGCGSSW